MQQTQIIVYAKQKFCCNLLLNDSLTVYLTNNLYQLKTEYHMDFGAHALLDCRRRYIYNVYYTCIYVTRVYDRFAENAKTKTDFLARFRPASFSGVRARARVAIRRARQYNIIVVIRFIVTRRSDSGGSTAVRTRFAGGSGATRRRLRRCGRTPRVTRPPRPV